MRGYKAPLIFRKLLCLYQLYWILGYLGCALFTMLICPPIVWMLDKHLKSGTYKDMWDYTYKGDDNPHPALIFL